MELQWQLQINSLAIQALIPNGKTTRNPAVPGNAVSDVVRRGKAALNRDLYRSVQ
jgi:hypothetical protein